MRQRLFLLGTVLFTALTLSASAQGTYTVSVSSGTYIDLVDPILISSDLDQVGYYVQVPFAMEGFGVQLDFDDDPQPPVVFTGGFVGINATSLDRLFVLDAFVSSMGRRDETSSLPYLLEGEGEDQVLKFQWKNMALIGNPTGDYVNVQLWLFRADNSYEIRVGPNRVTGKAAYSTYDGPAIGAFLSNAALSQYLATVHLAGDPANPALETFNAFYPMGGTPDDGTVYRFMYHRASSVDDVGGEGALSLRPNPASDGFAIDLPEDIEDGHAVVAIYDLLGREMLRTSNIRRGEYVSTRELPQGIYHVAVYDRTQVALTQRLVVAR